MPQPARKASLLVVLALLASVGAASAECAWVLWQHATMTKDGRMQNAWIIIDSFEMRDPWEMRKEFHIKAKRARGQQAGAAVEASGDYVTIRATGVEERFRTVCFPTGTDPREPKGR